jgi:uncharacterized circularly permuted ATP-grasp superfamily protein
MALSITGNAVLEGPILDATPLVFDEIPVVLKADLDDATSALNDTVLSNKDIGGLFIANNAGVYTMVTATGTATTDTWVLVNAATETVYTTPA